MKFDTGFSTSVRNWTKTVTEPEAWSYHQEVLPRVWRVLIAIEERLFAA